MYEATTMANLQLLFKIEVEGTYSKIMIKTPVIQKTYNSTTQSFIIIIKYYVPFISVCAMLISLATQQACKHIRNTLGYDVQ
jgi:hypothetical protein